MVYERVAAIIERSGIKQKAIAERIGVSEQTFSAMVSGRRKISAEEFYGICLAVNIEPNVMYGFNENENKVV